MRWLLVCIQSCTRGPVIFVERRVSPICRIGRATRKLSSVIFSSHASKLTYEPRTVNRQNLGIKRKCFGRDGGSGSWFSWATTETILCPQPPDHDERFAHDFCGHL